LREGLDLPEVSLVAILDADKEGFLRSATSLIQTAGRAARHINAAVVLYADVMTDSIRSFWRRRSIVAPSNWPTTKCTASPQTVKRELQLSLADLTKGARREARSFVKPPAVTRRRSTALN